MDEAIEGVAVAETGRSLTPHYPSYEEVRSLLPIWQGREANAVSRLVAAVYEHRGTPQATTDWTDPDRWIPERLAGEERALAWDIWKGTQAQVNPRYCRGHWYFCRRHGLLADLGDGKLSLTEDGKVFVAKPLSEVERRIDRWEGLLYLLSYLGDEGSRAPVEMREPWIAYLARETRIQAAFTAQIYLGDRLRNLLDRCLVRKLGRAYELTEEGLRHLEREPKPKSSPETVVAARIRRLLQEERERVRAELRECLHQMPPYAFEHLIRQLLEALGYSDVEVTKQSNDKGVDVRGRIEAGITSVTEVVQAKRTRSNVGRPVLDQLRGCLHRFGAVRGTIITTSGFAKGTREAAFDMGAAPITLIDGDKLVDLLIENEIGAKPVKLDLLTLDRSLFEEGSADTDSERL
jgi:restriction system protein